MRKKAAASWAMRLLAGAIALAGPGLAMDATTVTAAGDAAADFSFNWAGKPAAPQPWTPAGWDVIVHSRDERTWQSMDPVPAQHGADCSAPPAYHMITGFADAVFVCNNHLMTAFLPGGYGEIEMAPDRLLDWSQGPGVVSWHQSTFRTSARDWTDINVTPFSDNLVLPAEVTVDLSGEPRNGVQVAMSTALPTTFAATVYRDFGAESVPGTGAVLERVLTPSATQRAHFQLEVSRSHIRFGLPDQNVWFVDRDIAPLSFTSGVVQLGHHSYTPDKECASTGVLSCTGDTWHWSDFSMTPARQFTMLAGDAGQHISHDTAAVVHVTSGAPAGSFLRFAAIGSVGVSFDDGATWHDGRIQPATRNQAGKFAATSFNSYWMPVPEGTTRVTFSGADTYFSWWWVKDVSIWSAADPAALQPADAATAGIHGQSQSTAPFVRPAGSGRRLIAVLLPSAAALRRLPAGTAFTVLLLGVVGVLGAALGWHLRSMARRR